MRRYWRDALLVLVIVVGVRWWQAPRVDGEALPALDGRTLAGQSVSLASGEGPTVLHFWASWCGVCEAEASNVTAVARDARVITVASRSGSDADVAAYLQREGLSWTVVNDPGGQLAARYGVRAFPTTFVLDAEGKPVITEVGYTTTLGLRARIWFAGL